MFSKRKPVDLPFSSLQNLSINFEPVISGLKKAEFDDNKNVILTFVNTEKVQFNEDDKPEFPSPDYLESVIEYSGEATDGNKERSWAYAKFPPKGYSPNHHHNERDEEYLVTKGRALLIKVNVKGIRSELYLKQGDVAPIFKGEKHQIFNLSELEYLELVVFCRPAFNFNDYTKHPSNEFKQSEQQSINDVGLFGNTSPSTVHANDQAVGYHADNRLK
jgi:mannose-6-phosphate isomerase-like protein (cupin superfamily)